MGAGAGIIAQVFPAICLCTCHAIPGPDRNHLLRTRYAMPGPDHDDLPFHALCHHVPGADPARSDRVLPAGHHQTPDAAQGKVSPLFLAVSSICIETRHAPKVLRASHPILPNTLPPNTLLTLWGRARNYKNTLDAIKVIMQQEGVAGLYKGMSANTLKVIAGPHSPKSPPPKKNLNRPRNPRPTLNIRENEPRPPKLKACFPQQQHGSLALLAVCVAEDGYVAAETKLAA
eukprot:1149427-Rhodomonas_salina.2